MTTVVFSRLLNQNRDLLFSIINGVGALCFALGAYLLPLTVQPRIAGSFGAFLTPIEQIMQAPQVPGSELPGVILSWIGVGFTIAGTVMLTFTTTKIVKVSGLKQHESSELVTSGFWGIVRNPVYTSLLIIHLGTSLLLGGVYCLIFYPVFYGILHFSGWIETVVNLEPQFGKDQVAAYKARVPHSLFNRPLWLIIIILAGSLVLLGVLGYIPVF